MSRTMIYCRENNDRGQCLAILKDGQLELHLITARDAIRLAAELTAFAWRIEQRKPPPD